MKDVTLYDPRQRGEFREWTDKRNRIWYVIAYYGMSFDKQERFFRGAETMVPCEVIGRWDHYEGLIVSPRDDNNRRQMRHCAHHELNSIQPRRQMVEFTRDSITKLVANACTATGSSIISAV